MNQLPPRIHQSCQLRQSRASPRAMPRLAPPVKGLAMPNSCDNPVHLLKDAHGELTVPIHSEATFLILALESRGITLSADSDGTIAARPRHLLTDADRAAIRRLRPHILHALAYQAPGVH